MQWAAFTIRAYSSLAARTVLLTDGAVRLGRAQAGSVLADTTGTVATDRLIGIETRHALVNRFGCTRSVAAHLHGTGRCTANDQPTRLPFLIWCRDTLSALTGTGASRADVCLPGSAGSGILNINENATSIAIACPSQARVGGNSEDRARGIDRPVDPFADSVRRITYLPEAIAEFAKAELFGPRSLAPEWLAGLALITGVDGTGIIADTRDCTPSAAGSIQTTSTGAVRILIAFAGVLNTGEVIHADVAAGPTVEFVARNAGFVAADAAIALGNGTTEGPVASIGAIDALACVLIADSVETTPADRVVETKNTSRFHARAGIAGVKVAFVGVTVVDVGAAALAA